MYTPELVQELEGHGWLMDLRRQAAVNATEFSYPSREDEEWRYSPIEDLELDLFTPALTKPQSGTKMDHRKDGNFHNIFMLFLVMFCKTNMLQTTVFVNLSVHHPLENCSHLQVSG